LAIHVRAGADDRETSPYPYLLVHGSMDRASSFRRLQARLGEATIISYDRRGYAGSSARPPSTDFDDQVADLLEVLGGRPVVALGHSFGADVVAATAVRHPDLIRAAVLWEPPMPWMPWWPPSTAGASVLTDERDPAEVGESFMIRMVGRRVWERLPPTTRQARRDEGATLVAEMRALRGPVPWYPADLTVPVIVGTGEASQEHHRRACGELALALPDAELATIDGARHGAHLSHPGELADLLRRAAARVVDEARPVGTARAGAAESGRTNDHEENPA
jgi:pimeloyl-ACP methyl ester carboxylesterase